MSQKICLFPGTFDPITLGHINLIERVLPLFDIVYVGVGQNTSKTPMFDALQRKTWIDAIFKKQKKVSCIVYNGLTVDLCKQLKAKYILRGIRFVADFEYEKTIADTSRMLNPNIETIILTCEPPFAPIASSIVRDIIIHRGDITKFVHPIIVKDIYQLQQRVI